jgi:hypothetical protein
MDYRSYISERTRVWSSHADIHKMGWLDKGVLIHVVDHYGDRAQFDEVVSGFHTELIERTGAYPSWWVDLDKLSASNPLDEPAPPPEPGVAPSDAEIGRVVRYLFGK